MTAAERETVIDDYLERPLKGAEEAFFAAVTTPAQQAKVQGALSGVC